MIEKQWMYLVHNLVLLTLWWYHFSKQWLILFLIFNHVLTKSNQMLPNGKPMKKQRKIKKYMSRKMLANLKKMNMTMITPSPLKFQTQMQNNHLNPLRVTRVNKIKMVKKMKKKRNRFLLKMYETSILNYLIMLFYNC